MTCAKKAFADLPLLQAAFRPEDPAAECSYPACDKDAGSERWESCLQGWVDVQMQKHADPGAFGTTCGSLPPMYYRQCVNSFIWDNMPEALPTCGCEPFDHIQTCLNRVVDDRINGRPPADPVQRGPMVDLSCQMVPDATGISQCYTDWAIQQQQAAPESMWGDDCNSVPADKQKECASEWVRANIPKADCRGTPEEVQACMYSAMDRRMQCPESQAPVQPSPVITPSKPCADVGPDSASDAYQQCIDAAVHDVIQSNLPAGFVDAGCWNATPSGGFYSQQCVNLWITTNGGKKLAPAGTSADAPRFRSDEGCNFAAMVSEDELTKMVQDCYNGVAERLIQDARQVPSPRPQQSIIGTPATASCANKNPQQRVQCISAWVNAQVLAEIEAEAATRPGMGLANSKALGCLVPNYDDIKAETYNPKCIRAWIQAHLDDPLRTVEPVLPDRCFVTPSGDSSVDDKRHDDCYHALVEEAMAASTTKGNNNAHNAPAPSNPSVAPVQQQSPAVTPAVTPIATPTCEGLQDWDAYQSCIFSWVNAKVLAETPVQNMNGPGFETILPTGPGLGCLLPASNSGAQQSYHSNCITSWIWDNITEALPKCGCEANPNDSGNVVSCLYGLVVDTMAGRPITMPSIDHNAPVMVGGCGSLPRPEDVQQCWNNGLMDYMRKNKQASDCGTSADQQSCINHWAVNYLPKAGRCLLKPSQDATQDCINTAIAHMVRCPIAAPASPPIATVVQQSPAATTSSSCKDKSPDQYQNCIDTWVNNQMLVQGTSTTGGCLQNTPEGGYSRSCVNDWIVNNLTNPPAKPGEPQMVGACVFGPSGNQAEDDKRFQDCLNAAVEARMPTSAA